MTINDDQSNLSSSNMEPVPQLPASDYAKHPNVVKQYNEWILSSYQYQIRKYEYDLRQKDIFLEGKTKELAETEKQLSLLKQELSHFKQTSFYQRMLSILALLLTGFGINLVTTNPSNFAAWILIVGAIVIQLAQFDVHKSILQRKN